MKIRRSKSRTQVRVRVSLNRAVGESLFYKVRSRDPKMSKEVIYEPVIVMSTGEVFCRSVDKEDGTVELCPHMRYRCNPEVLGHSPTTKDYKVLCHHLQRAVRHASKRGWIQDVSNKKTEI